MKYLTVSTTKRLLAGLAVVAASVLVSITVIIPRITGGAALTVLSGSMTPTYPVGSIVVVRPIDARDAQVGDVVTFTNGDSLTTHRITSIDEDADGDRLFTTKGDANRGEDLQPVPEEDLRGRVWFHVPLLGYLREFVSSATGLLAIAILAVLAAFSDRLLSLRRRRSSSDPAELAADPTELPSTPEPEAKGARERVGTAGDSSLAPGSLVGVAHPRCVTQASEIVAQELLLLRLAAGALERGQVLELVGLLRAHVVAVSSFEMILTVVGTSDELDGAERLLRPYGIVESARSEVVSIGGEPEPATADESALLLPYAPAPRPVTDLELLVRPLSRNGSSR